MNKLAAKNGSSARAKAIAGKLPVGRPRTKLEDIDPNWESIMRQTAQRGEGVTSIMVQLGIGHQALSTLCEDYPIFTNTLEECVLLCKDWWEKQGNRMVTGGDGNASVYKMHMVNRFGWTSEKQQLGSDPANPLLMNTNTTLTIKPLELSKDDLIAELRKRGLPTAIFDTERPTKAKAKK